MPHPSNAESTFNSLRTHFDSTSISFCLGLDAISLSVRNSFEVALNLHSSIPRKFVRSDFTSESLRIHSDFTSNSLRFRSSVMSMSLRIPLEFSFNLLRSQCDVTSSTRRFHLGLISEFTSNSLRCHFANFDFISTLPNSLAFDSSQDVHRASLNAVCSCDLHDPQIHRIGMLRGISLLSVI